MSDGPGTAGGTPPASEQERVDKICDSVEPACKGEERPQIEQSPQGSPEAAGAPGSGGASLTEPSPQAEAEKPTTEAAAPVADPVPIPYPGITCPHCKIVQWALPKFFGQSVPCRQCGRLIAMPDHLRMACPRCQRSVKIRPKHFGEQVSCVHCDYDFAISRFMQIACPSCGRQLRVRPAHLHGKLGCKYCDYAFYSLGPNTSELAQRSGEPSAAELPQVVKKRSRWNRLRRRVQELERSLAEVVARLDAAQRRFPEALHEAHSDRQAKQQAIRKEQDAAIQQIEQVKPDAQQRAEELEKQMPAEPDRDTERERTQFLELIGNVQRLGKGASALPKEPDETLEQRKRRWQPVPESIARRLRSYTWIMVLLAISAIALAILALFQLF